MVPAQLACPLGRRQADSLLLSKVAPWPGSSALLSPAHPALCPVPSALPHPAWQGQGVGQTWPPCPKAHWLLQTSRLAGLSKALTSSMGQSRAGEERQKRAGASDAFAFLWKTGGYGFPRHMHTPIHSANTQGHPPGARCW